MDKPISPYSPIADFNLPDKPGCRNSVIECIPPYSFRHIISLTNNEQEIIVNNYYILNAQYSVHYRKHYTVVLI